MSSRLREFGETPPIENISIEVYLTIAQIRTLIELCNSTKSGTELLSYFTEILERRKRLAEPRTF
jgi:hypothetical protein